LPDSDLSRLELCARQISFLVRFLNADLGSSFFQDGGVFIIVGQVYRQTRKEAGRLKGVRGMIHPTQRAFDRNEVEAPLQFKIPETDALAVTRLYNVCQGGVYFESQLPMEPGHETTIVIPDLIAESAAPGVYAGYRVRIRWCNELKKQEPKYGIGAQFLAKTEELKKAAVLKRPLGCELCGRGLGAGCICHNDGTVCLCLTCYKHLEGIPEGSVRESILRFIDGNVI
jgi:PilZ domain